MPEALWLLLAVPVFWPLWWWRQRHRPTLRHPDLRFVAAAPSWRTTWARHLPFGFRVGAVVLTILALAGPRWPDPGSRIPSEGIALMIVLDVSGSMAERDVLLSGQPVSRLQAAVAVLGHFMAGGEGFSARDQDAMGIVTFAVRPLDVCPPTLSHHAVHYFLRHATPIGTVPDSSTNIGDAIAVATNLLRRSPIKSKAMLVISDGEHNVPREVDPDALSPREAAQLAAALGIRVHTIFLAGSPSGDAAALASRQKAEAALAEVARITQGQAATADDGQNLAEISRRLDTLEKSRVESFFYTQYAEAAPWLILGALICMILAVVSEEVWFRVVP
jgi:Ca-activated chloride channel family protein